MDVHEDLDQTAKNPNRASHYLLEGMILRMMKFLEELKYKLSIARDELGVCHLLKRSRNCKLSLS